MSGMTQAPPLHGGLTSAWCPAGKAPSCNQTSLLFRLSDILCLLQRLVPATYTGLLEGQVAKRGASKQQAPQGGASVWLCGEKGGHSWGSWAPGGAEGVVRVTGDRGEAKGVRNRLGAGPASEAEAQVARWHCLGRTDGNPQKGPVPRQGPGPNVICGSDAFTPPAPLASRTPSQTPGPCPHGLWGQRGWRPGAGV